MQGKVGSAELLNQANDVGHFIFLYAFHNATKSAPMRRLGYFVIVDV